MLTRQAMYVYRNIQARPYNHYCSEKAIIMTYSDGVFVAFGTQCAMRMRHIVICGQAGSTVFFHLVS
jgi:hypothetical protein